MLNLRLFFSSAPRFKKTFVKNQSKPYAASHRSENLYEMSRDHCLIDKFVKTINIRQNLKKLKYTKEEFRQPSEAAHSYALGGVGLLFIFTVIVNILTIDLGWYGLVCTPKAPKRTQSTDRVAPDENFLHGVTPRGESRPITAAQTDKSISKDHQTGEIIQLGEISVHSETNPGDIEQDEFDLPEIFVHEASGKVITPQGDDPLLKEKSHLNDPEELITHYVDNEPSQDEIPTLSLPAVLGLDEKGLTPEREWYRYDG